MTPEPGAARDRDPAQEDESQQGGRTQPGPEEDDLKVGHPFDSDLDEEEARTPDERERTEAGDIDAAHRVLHGQEYIERLLLSPSKYWPIRENGRFIATVGWEMRKEIG